MAVPLYYNNSQEIFSLFKIAPFSEQYKKNIAQFVSFFILLMISTTKKRQSCKKLKGTVPQKSV
jgi:hypothetical protein